ncbi:RNA polymerase sigma factor [Spirosoma panaciterrae]|uniref:RNA polymerase sigma factor n=1 Tax=Spirosoma panaciterrae TaxID=496058 RepID=UPI0003785886|nr:RNA polymerase sigma-70 factor [Spirosoma panaciterrae]
MEHHSYQAYSDSQLIEMLADDDSIAFEALYNRYFTRLFNYTYEKSGDQFIAQEIVQELFINFWQQRKQLFINRSVNGYLYTAAKHLIIDQHRREVTRNHHTDQFVTYQTSVSNQTEEQIRVNELQRTYMNFLNQLPDKCRCVFSLSREGFSNREIAEQMNISEKTVEQHITKALRQLRAQFPQQLLILFIISFFK